MPDFSKIVFDYNLAAQYRSILVKVFADFKLVIAEFDFSHC